MLEKQQQRTEGFWPVPPPPPLPKPKQQTQQTQQQQKPRKSLEEGMKRITEKIL